MIDFMFMMIDSYDWVMLIMMIDDVNAWNINLMIKNAVISIHEMLMILCYVTCYG